MTVTLLIIIVHVICTIQCATLSNFTVTKKHPTESIQKLEKEKLELYKQINMAIADTLKVLEKSNDTEAKEGLTYMLDLQKQIQELNGTDLLEEEPAHNSTEDTSALQEIAEPPENVSSTLISGRRKAHDRTGYEKIKKAILSFGKGRPKIFEEEDGSQVMSKKAKMRLETALIMQKKVDEWMAQRLAEKKKINEYKARLQREHTRVDVIVEKCPDFGEEKQKKKKSNSKMDKYPCCRKCCKKSYMGCL